MRNILKNRNLLALALTASLSTFGCTTNWHRGDGEPATGSTNVTSPSATPGTSGGTTALPQPMTSSSRLTESPSEALAIMQMSRPTTQGRVLGPVNPPNTGEARTGGSVMTSPSVAPTTVTTSPIASSATTTPIPSSAVTTPGTGSTRSSAISITQNANGKIVISNQK